MARSGGAGLPYQLNKETIKRDLDEDLPGWVLSCYGPGRDAPEQLFGGFPREQSADEIRWHYMQGAMSGNPQGALSEIEGLYNDARQHIQTARNNVDAAVQFIVDAGNRHPNRLDICKQSAPEGKTTGEFAVGRPRPEGDSAGSGSFANTQQQPGGFGAATAGLGSNGAFGQASALGQKPSPFGQAAQLGTGSAFVKAAFAQPAFGQPSQPSAGSSAFGQPAQLGSQIAFGKPAFGQAAAPVGGAFGQPSALGQKPNPFAAPAAATPAFGQPTQPTSAFGQPAALGQKANPFGAAPSALGTNAPSPFGQAADAQKTNPFGQANPLAGNAFGQASGSSSNPFGQAAPNPIGFGQAATANPFGQAQTSGPFGSGGAASAGNTANPSGQAAAAAAAAAAAPSPFGAPSGSSTATGQQQASTFGGGNGGSGKPNGPYGPGSTRTHPDMNTYSSKGADGKLRMFKGRPITYARLKDTSDKSMPVYRNPDGSMTRVWFPDGAPAYLAETEAPPDMYTDDVVRAWKVFVDTGTFADGVMPLVPPQREWCMWDF